MIIGLHAAGTVSSNFRHNGRVHLKYWPIMGRSVVWLYWLCIVIIRPESLVVPPVGIERYKHRQVGCLLYRSCIKVSCPLLWGYVCCKCTHLTRYCWGIDITCYVWLCPRFLVWGLGIGDTLCVARPYAFLCTFAKLASGKGFSSSSELSINVTGEISGMSLNRSINSDSMVVPFVSMHPLGLVSTEKASVNPIKATGMLVIYEETTLNLSQVESKAPPQLLLQNCWIYLSDLGLCLIAFDFWFC